MVEEIALDSSVLVSALIKGDQHRPQARKIMEKIFSGEYSATISTIVPVEVCGSISKRAGIDKATMAKDQLIKWNNLNLINYNELTEERQNEAVDLAVKLRMKGMDAIVVQTAKEKERTLITFDDEMAEKAKATVKVLTYRDFK